MMGKYRDLINVLTILLVFSMSGCGPPAPENFVIVPASDNTLPTVGMMVNDSKVNINVNESSQPVTIRAGADTVAVIAGATDQDGGIKTVGLYAAFTYYNPGQTSGPGLVGSPVQQDVSNAKVGESTLKNRFFQHNFDLKKERGNWTSIKIDVWTEGENFHGGMARTPTVSITYP
jgi:hypothetical protein